MTCVVLFLIFLGLLLLGSPISLAMGSGAMGAAITGGYDLTSLALLISNGSSNYTLVAIPYFVFLGNLMNMAGITDRIFDFADALVGHIKGGLAQVNVLASVIFAGISGTSTADAAGLGLVEIRAMERKGYPLDFSVAITMASSVLGPIIPPSVTLLVFASITSTSVAKLFMAGVIPGVLVALALCGTNYFLYVTKRVEMPAPVKFSARRLWTTFRKGFFALCCPVILMVTMMSGVVTPTEAGIVGVLYSLFVALVYRELTLKRLIKAMVDTVYSCAIIMFLIGMGTAVGWFLTAEQIPQLVSELMLSFTSNKIILLIIINILLLILGMFMDGTTIQLIMVPILLPIIDALMISRLQFGVMVTINILIGTITPPFGVGLFIMSAISNLSIPKVFKAAIPFMIPLVIALLCITYVPFFTTWLPSILG